MSVYSDPKHEIKYKIWRESENGVIGAPSIGSLSRLLTSADEVKTITHSGPDEEIAFKIAINALSVLCCDEAGNFDKDRCLRAADRVLKNLGVGEWVHEIMNEQNVSE
jgi:hypothetical protein